MKKTFVSILLLQALGASLVLLVNFYLLRLIGGASYLKISTGFAIFAMVNYFDFGLIGLIRRIAASPNYSEVEKINLVYSENVSFFKKVAIYELLVAVFYLILINFISIPIEIILSLIFAPLMIFVNTIRAYYEGRDKIFFSNVLRNIYGLSIVTSPFLSHYFTGNFLLFPCFIVINLSLILIVFWIKKYRAIDKDSRVQLTFNANNTISIEMSFMWFGVFLLYFDRFFLRSVNSTDEAGQYVFLIEIASRLSLIYVPLVLLFYPKIVEKYDKNILEIRNYIKKSELKIVGIMVSIAILVGLGLYSVLNITAISTFIKRTLTDENMIQIMILFLAFAINSSNYYKQRIISLYNIKRSVVIKNYGYVSILYLGFVLATYYTLGVNYLPLAILLRIITENLFLRRILHGNV